MAKRIATMYRELLIEIGCEELPASWLLPLTRQIGEQVIHLIPFRADRWACAATALLLAAGFALTTSADEPRHRPVRKIIAEICKNATQVSAVIVQLTSPHPQRSAGSPISGASRAPA